MIRAGVAGPVPVVLLDRFGYRSYHRRDGTPFLPCDQYSVRLVTDVGKLDEAKGPEIESVLGIRLDEETSRCAAAFQCNNGAAAAAGLVAISEVHLLLGAQLRQELGLTGPHVPDVLPFRDKIIMKQHLRDQGIRVPDFMPFDRRAARSLLQTHRRLFVKPRLGAGSMDVTVLASQEDIEQLARNRPAAAQELDIEEYIDGQLFHIDSVVDHGRVVAATAGRTIDPTTSYQGLQPCRDVGVAEGPELDTLLAFNEAVLSCHPTFSGVTHHEVFLARGEPVFCEIAARPGGGGVVPGFHSRTGANLNEITVHAQLGAPVPSQLEIAEHLTGYVMIYSDSGAQHALPALAGEPWVIDTRISTNHNQERNAPGDWGDAAVVLTVRGETEQQVTLRLDQAVERLAP
ncbi:ATP-grasp domain-containing protein [Actinomadura graeca]|uniref:ATP-grasp domain-containing protein n=1 Tax=Actinomadura graeca TaxID=2750812 RepID=A0ABX8R470_9ACTN|nr:ATP-grasp domain-containing protein [Actinomadura graeca]QXJ25866.1 ATP-grasp domain-containing protein [Actinomadura graeca]